MAEVVALQGGTAEAVYDDRWRCIYEALGVLSVRRASEVEFDALSGEWVATHCASGQIIGRGRGRSRVIAQEVVWLEANVIGQMNVIGQAKNVDAENEVITEVNNKGEENVTHR